MSEEVVDTNESPPESVRVLSNGAWQDKATGQIVRAPQSQLWDSKKASEMAKKRWAKVQERTRSGIQSAVQKKHPKKVIQGFPEAHEVVVETLMDEVVLNEEEKGKTRVDSYTALLAIEGSARSQKELEMRENDLGVTIHFSPEVARHMVDRLVERKSHPEETIIEVSDE
jgi:hypothetical protein